MTRPIRGLGVLVASAAVIVIGAGCSGSGGKSTASSTPSVSPPAASSGVVSASGTGSSAGGSSTAGSATKGGSSTSRSSKSRSASQHPTTYPPPPSSSGATQQPQRTKSPIAITHTGTFGGRVTGSITKVQPLTAKARVPGEVSGPALAITIRLVNGSAKTLSLGNAVVNLAYGAAETPGSPMSGPPNRPFTGSLKAGKIATAVYVFRIPRAGGHPRLTIQVSYSPYAPVVVFSGTE